jgi:hypothetical protein
MTKRRCVGSEGLPKSSPKWEATTEGMEQDFDPKDHQKWAAETAQASS